MNSSSAAADKGQERRETPRRKKHLKVVVAGPETEADSFTAWVIDRSMGGMLLSAANEITLGKALRIRPAALADGPWVSVEITSCRPEENGWLLGCRFVRTPSYAVLLQFG